MHLVRDRETGKHVALKQMSKLHFDGKNAIESAFAELEILGKRRSRWFVELIATFQDARYVYNVMEFMQGGDLRQLINRSTCIAESATRFYMAELLEALDTVHRAGVAHRDVKPENIALCASGHLKLLDFGICRRCPLECAEVFANRTRFEVPCGQVRVSVLDLDSSQFLWTACVDPFKITLAEVKVSIAKECGMSADILQLSVAAPENLRKQSNLKLSSACRLLVEDGLSLADHGLDGSGPYVFWARRLESSAKKPISNAGTPIYQPPEVFAGYDHGPEGDLWALGLITFECLVGANPFVTMSVDLGFAVEHLPLLVSRHEQSMSELFKLRRVRSKISTDVAKTFIISLVCAKKHRVSAEQCRNLLFFDGIDFHRIHEQRPPWVPPLKGADDTRWVTGAKINTPEKLPATDYRELLDPALLFAGYNHDAEGLAAASRTSMDVDSLVQGSLDRSGRSQGM